jgi:hypothetical protein
MILNDKKPSLEMSDVMKATAFSVGDLGMLFDILRSKLYSNPIQVICREISCNARDAHREVGTPNKPIQITLPTASDPNLRIKDWGPGLSQERVETIFVKFGSSTKRDTNEQTGAWGLGGKSPFAYTDQFAIETIHQGVKYCYSAIIDPTKVGKLINTSKIATTETNGTEVIIPIQSKDFRTFIEGIEYTTRWFKPSPSIKGGKISYQKPNVIVEGKNWSITESFSYNRNVRLLIDGIEYPLDFTALSGYRSLKILNEIQGDVSLSFNTGDLSLSASREAVHLDEATEKKITARLKSTYEDLKASIQANIDKCKTLKEAGKYYASNVCNTFPSLHGLQWKGITLTASIYPGRACTFTRTNKTSAGLSTLYYRNSDDWGDIYLNDVVPYHLITKAMVEPIFKADKSLSKIMVISSSEYYAKDKELLPETLEAIKKSIKGLAKNINAKELEAQYLSDFIEAPKPKEPPVPRMSVFKLEGKKFCRVAYKTIAKDTNEKVLCSLTKDKYSITRYAATDKQSLYPADLAVLAADKKVSIYGLDKSVAVDKVKKHFKNFKPLKDFITSAYTDSTIDYVKIAALQWVRSNAYFGNISSHFHKNVALDNKASPLIEIFKKQDEQNTFLIKHQPSLVAYENFVKKIPQTEIDAWLKKNPEENLTKSINDIRSLYPLLECVGYGSKRSDIVQYVNAIDYMKAHKKEMP